MKTIVFIALFLVAAGVTWAQQGTGMVASVEWKRQPPVAGWYGPNPKITWFAGEQIRIRGTSFHYTYFSDVVGNDVPDYNGTVVMTNDYILLDHPAVPYPYRISGLLDKKPVLWDWEEYQVWTKTGKIPEEGILYYEGAVNHIDLSFWQMQTPTNGLYVLAKGMDCPSCERIQIDGTNFYAMGWSRWSGNRVYTGQVVIAKDHIFLDHPGMAFPYRISGVLSNQPVLWS